MQNALKKGGGINHLCYEVNNIYEEIKILEKKSFRLVTVKPGAGHIKLVCFLYSVKIGLIELVEKENKMDLLQFVSETFAVDKSTLKLETAPGDFPGMGLLGHLSLLTALEKFNISFDMDETMSIQSIGDLKIL